jgi:DNA-directed RNA polymerase specialized sigma24 family protein
MRWAIVAGLVEEGTGPATQRTGPAFLTARSLVDEARAERDSLRAISGHAWTDGVLAGTAPLLGALLGDLTDRQREVARLILVDGLRRAGAAETLGISRPTVSVLASRGRVREIGRLAGSLAELFRHGAQT